MQLTRTSVLAAPLVIAMLFAASLLGIDRLAFRDVSHFYTPLYDYVSFRSESQWLPLWNPLDQTGIPLIGETTTAFFYPLRYLLYALPISAEFAIAWHTALHLILASLAARYCARLSGASRVSATIAGVLYPLSGSVLFLYTNPPFLVGAAWLPLVLGPILSRKRLAFSKRVLIAAPSMAMMILGGDPQMALHATLVAGAVCLVRLFRESPADRRRMLGVLVGVPLLAAAMSAPQIAASLSWSGQSERLQSDDAGRWLQPPRTDSRRFEAFQFSLPPWHVVELVTPNAFGSLIPVNQRISSLIAGEGRMWTPSIYVGMIVALALLSRIVRLRKRSMDAWLSIAIASLLLSLGHFGFVWVIQNCTGLLADRDSAIGGPYWFLYHFLPAYDAFRYPAKWLPLFSLAATIVTATWVDRDLWRQVDVIRRVTIGLFAAVSIASLCVVALRWNPSLIFDPANDQLPSDEFWGPLSIAGGLGQVQQSLLHSVVALIAITLVLRLRAKGWRRRDIKLALLAIVLIDLAISGREWIHQVPIKQERRLAASLVSNGMHLDTAEGAWMRTQADGGWPNQWRSERDRNRLQDVEVSVRHAWFGRWHLADRQAVFNNMTSIQSQRMTLFWQAAFRVSRDLDPQQQDAFWDSVGDWLGMGQVIHTNADSVEVNDSGRTAVLVKIARLKRESVSPPIQFHRAWKNIGDDMATLNHVEQMLVEIRDHNSTRLPLLQTDSVIAPVSEREPSGQPQQVTMGVLEERADEIEIEIQTETPGLLTRATLQDGNWIAQYTDFDRPQDWQSSVVVPVDHLKQGTVIPAGHWRVRFRYAPKWLGWSIAIAMIAWSIGLIAIIRLRRFPQANGPVAPDPTELASSSVHRVR